MIRVPEHKPKLRIITVTLSVENLEGVNELLLAGKYASRAEIVRLAIRELIEEVVQNIKKKGLPAPVENFDFRTIQWRNDK